jgi:catechol 2,3-dioxygenase-like lactoylglutathione lyase family enzyme
MRFPGASACAALALAVLSVRPLAAQAPTLPYDHIHLNVPDPAAAAKWYEEQFGAKRLDEGPNRLTFGGTRFLFAQRAGAQPSAGSSVDHIGFSVPDLDAKLKALEAAGAKITTPAREAPGLFKLAFVEDPWGIRLEVVQDQELPGLHHLHLRGPDPEAVMSWLLTNFGGERAQMKGRLEAVRYMAPGNNPIWVLVQKGESAPTDGRAIDHLGWQMPNLAAGIAALKKSGVTVTTEPRPVTLPNKSTITIAFVEGPGGIKIELVQR